MRPGHPAPGIAGELWVEVGVQGPSSEVDVIARPRWTLTQQPIQLVTVPLPPGGGIEIDPARHDRLLSRQSATMTPQAMRAPLFPVGSVT